MDAWTKIFCHQNNKNKQQSKDKMPRGFEHAWANEASKYTNGKLGSQRMRYLLVGVSMSTKKWNKTQRNGDLGL